MHTRRTKMHVYFPWCFPKWKNIWPFSVIWLYRWSFIQPDSQCIDMWLMECLYERECRKWLSIPHRPHLKTIYLACILGSSESKWSWNTFPNDCTSIACLHRCFATFTFVDVPVNTHTTISLHYLPDVHQEQCWYAIRTLLGLIQ